MAKAINYEQVFSIMFVVGPIWTVTVQSNYPLPETQYKTYSI